MRIGIGYDIHRLVIDRPCILGGVRLPSQKGLLGHSDADVLLHAISDALLGALALGDIGKHFPDTAEENRHLDSRVILKKAYHLIAERGYRVGNVDATVIADVPRLQPHLADMAKGIAEILGVTPGDVSIKATTNEGIGTIGRQEGIAAFAVALLEKVGK